MLVKDSARVPANPVCLAWYWCCATLFVCQNVGGVIVRLMTWRSVRVRRIGGVQGMP